MQNMMMRAIRQSQFGGPEVLGLVSMARPEPRATEVLVRVAAAGVNPIDWKTRSGYGTIGKPPFIVGWDVAGTVEGVGSGVTRFSVGDRVFGMPEFPREAGAYAEYVTSRSRHLARIPEGMEFVDAAALPLSSLIAWQSLVDTAGVGQGDRVLIQGAAGGVGHLAVQIAKSLGAYVLGTCAPQDMVFLKELGVDEPIDFTQQDASESVRDVDVVLDLVGGPVCAASLPVLRDGGLLISVPSFTDLVPVREEAADRVRVTGILVEPDRVGMEAIADLAAMGKLQARVAHVFPLKDAASAHELGETGEAAGKIVLTVA
ncbi:NADP-dependent oxidoreductase [Streptomyces kronopolitis]|uniref:NADP-dependent oxidoreductase n=1 Tax=Streptomyces kronopolitis TaxID=1612435 RepID=UPI00368D5A48